MISGRSLNKLSTVAFVILASLIFSTLGLAANDGTTPLINPERLTRGASSKGEGTGSGSISVKELTAPLAPGHNVNFQTDGLPAGVAFTITGTRVNNGGHPTTYEVTFLSPGPSNNLGADPGSEFTFTGFPTSVIVAGQYYAWVSTTPSSPFTIGDPGGSTTVVALYEATCLSPTITLEPINQTAVYGSPVTLTVASTGTLPLSYQWFKDGNLIPGADQPDYVILSAEMADAGSYHAEVSNSCGAATSNSAILTVNKAEQTILFIQPPTPAVFESTFTVNPTASSGLPVSLTTAGSCTNAGFEVTMVSGTGLCVLTASQPGNDNYNPAPEVVRYVDAIKADQEIDFPQPPTPAVYGTSFDVYPVASSGLPVSITAAGGCTSTAGDVTMTSGTISCTLTATQSGDLNFNPAPDIIRIVDAQKADQEITFLQPPSPLSFGTTFAVEAASSSGLPVEISTSGSCTNSGYDVTITGGSGTCQITASQSGDDNYNPATDLAHSVEAIKADQTIDFPQPISPATFGFTFDVVANASSGLPTNLAVAGVCSLSDTSVRMTSGVGTCSITASQQGDSNYNPATNVLRQVAAAKANQSITFTQPVSPAVFGSTFTINAKSSSGLPVALSSEGSCSNIDYEVIMVSGTGYCILTTSQTGNENFHTAPEIVRWVEAVKLGQDITFEQPASPAKYRTSFLVNPTATSGLPVTLSASGSCQADGNQVTMTLSSGTCTLSATQSGDDNYLPAQSVVRTVEVAPNGNIVFLPLLSFHR